MDLMTLFLGTGGGGVLGFVGAAFQQRRSAEGVFNARVDERLKQLEAAVAECEKERPVIAVLKTSVCMLVPEVLRQEPGNPVLRAVSSALSALPSSDDGPLEELIAQLKEIP